MNKERIKKIISPLLGKNKFQNFFETLHRVSLLGMNIGADWDPKKSGEEFTLNYIYSRLKQVEKINMFDVGANVGKYSLLIKEVFGNKAKIYSFEPSLKTFQKLQFNAGQVGGISLYNFGFGDKNIKTSLFSDSNESGLASVYKRNLDHFGINMDKFEEVDIKTLDSFCEESNINHIHFLKMDVEGHEKKVLEGAQRLLKSKAIDFIQFEFGGCNIDSRTFFQDFYYLLKDNYKIFRILKDGLRKIDTYKEELEVFKPTNYLAEIIN